LVDRVWPRGVSKQSAHINAWLKSLAPTTELRKWFGHDPERWEEFQRRYHVELDEQRDQIAELISLADGKHLTLIYAAKDEEHNNAAALKAFLLAHKRTR